MFSCVGQKKCERENVLRGGHFHAHAFSHEQRVPGMELAYFVPFKTCLNIHFSCVFVSWLTASKGCGK